MKYLKSKSGSLENSILSVWSEAAKKIEGLDPVNKLSTCFETKLICKS